MQKITFITSNQGKADNFAKYLGLPIDHHKLDLEEIQSLNLAGIVEHKARQAYKIIKKPVLVDDVSLEFAALGKLPGPFIKFFLEELGDEGICRLLDGKDRGATGRCIMGYYDGQALKLFESKINGSISVEPKGENGFGWDKIFIPEGYSGTRAELNEKDQREVYLKIRQIDQLKKFLEASQSLV